MSEQPTSRRQFLRQSAIATSAATVIGCSLGQQTAVMAAQVDRSITVKTPPAVRQIDVLFDPANYTAFPHVVRLDGDELMMAFRQAPRQKQVRHTHPRSVITVIRSYDLGETWDIENAGQLAAGGGYYLIHPAITYDLSRSGIHCFGGAHRAQVGTGG